MPEGDTIHRTATALHRALAERPLTRFDAPRLTYRPFPPGTSVEGVEAVGKHCLVRFDDGRTLHTHLGMTGSWHLYRPGERWQKKPAAARVVLEVGGRDGDGGWVAVCFAAPVVEVRWEAPVDHLGPDLCLAGADLEEAVQRLGRFGAGRTVGDALLDQRVAAGIGNVYKSEACFACGVHPSALVDDLDGATRRALVQTAADQLRANLTTAIRTTVAGGLAVYGRGGRPCRRCGTRIAWARQGEHQRRTYWCPACQPAT